VRLWDVVTGKQVLQWTEHKRGVHSLAWGGPTSNPSQIKSLVATGSMAGDIFIWDVRSRSKVMEFIGFNNNITSLNWGCDDNNHLLATSWECPDIKMFDLRKVRPANLGLSLFTGRSQNGIGIRNLSVEQSGTGSFCRAVGNSESSIYGWDLWSARNSSIIETAKEGAFMVRPSWECTTMHDQRISQVELTSYGYVSCCEGGLVSMVSFQQHEIDAQA